MANNAKVAHIPATSLNEAMMVDVSIGKQALEPFSQQAAKVGIPMALIEDHQVSTPVEVHRAHDDLFYVLSGELELVTGGVVIDPAFFSEQDVVNENEIRASHLEGGEALMLEAGAVARIPAGLPHFHRTETTARFFVIKIPTCGQVPLEDVPGWHV